MLKKCETAKFENPDSQAIGNSIWGMGKMLEVCPELGKQAEFTGAVKGMLKKCETAKFENPASQAIGNSIWGMGKIYDLLGYKLLPEDKLLWVSLSKMLLASTSKQALEQAHLPMTTHGLGVMASIFDRKVLTKYLATIFPTDTTSLSDVAFTQFCYGLACIYAAHEGIFNQPNLMVSIKRRLLKIQEAKDYQLFDSPLLLEYYHVALYALGNQCIDQGLKSEIDMALDLAPTSISEQQKDVASEIGKKFSAITTPPKLEVKNRGYRLDVAFTVELKVSPKKTISLMVNVEIDGNHHYPMNDELRARDKLRDAILILKPTRYPRLVVRVKNNECKDAIIRLQTEIFNFLESHLENPEEVDQAKRLLGMTDLV